MLKALSRFRHLLRASLASLRLLTSRLGALAGAHNASRRAASGWRAPRISIGAAWRHSAAYQQTGLFQRGSSAHSGAAFINSVLFVVAAGGVLDMMMSIILCSR